MYSSRAYLILKSKMVHPVRLKDLCNSLLDVMPLVTFLMAISGPLRGLMMCVLLNCYAEGCIPTTYSVDSILLHPYLQ